MDVKIEAVQLTWEEGCNIIVGQSHFIKTVEDIPEIVVSTVPGIEYGLAFCEASGLSLIRTEGNDEALLAQATECARAVGAGHTFYVIIRKGFPINFLSQIKACQEVASIYAATANPLQIIVAETGQGRGIMGVIDGNSPAGVEGEAEKRERKELLRKFGYKFG
jgi:hypothetical protein